MIEFHFEKAPAVSWNDTINNRIQRGKVVALVNTSSVVARLYYDDVDNKFALQAHITAINETRLFDCELRSQRGRMDMVFRHPNYGGVPVTVGDG